MTRRKQMIKPFSFLLLFCGLLFSAVAQQGLDTGMEWNEELKQFDQSAITSGILYDRVLAAAGLQDFHTREGRNVADLLLFRQAISELYRASNQEKFISNDDLLKNIDEYERKDNEVLLGLIHSDFHRLNFNKENPEESGVSWDGETFNLINGQPTYLEQQVLMIAPMIKAVQGKKIQFAFNTDFLFTNTKTTIEKLTADFGENQIHHFIKNGKMSSSKARISYPSSGEKTIQFEALLSDGSVIKTAGKLYVRSLNEVAQRSVPCTQNTGLVENGTVTADIPFQGYDENYPIYGQIDYRIYFRLTGSRNPSNLLKPIIIIDGFDPGDTRKILDCDCEQDPDCAAEYTVGGQFMADGYRGHRSIEDLMLYNNDQNNLITELRQLGYDVIIVNHPTYMGLQTNGQSVEVDGGADYIERNALTLTKLIREINSRLTAPAAEDIAIVGPSMGGQISRYALAYMEERNANSRNSEWDHKVRLWISIDSPHLGANLPMGVQSLIDQAARKGVQTAIDFRDKELRSAASKQQLIEQHYVPGNNGWNPTPAYMDGRTISQGFSSNHGAPFYQQYYDALFNNGLPNSDGYPQNLRKVALTNGSLTGSKSYFNPFDQANDLYPSNGQKVINIRGFQNVCVPPPICFDVHIASLEAYFLPPTGSNSKISRFKKLTSDNSAYATNSNNRGNLDNAPGGWFDAQMQLTATTLDNSPTGARSSFSFSLGSMSEHFFEFLSNLLGGSEWDVRDLEPVHSFIPTFSALGHTSPNQSWAQSLSDNQVCLGDTPFDSYYGEAQNTQHTSFNQSSVDWLKEELAGNPQEPYFPVSASALSGPTNICQGSTRTYSFATCTTPGPVAEWTKSSNLTLISSTANSITVRATVDSRNSGWVKAKFDNDQEIQKTVWVGKPKSPVGSISGPTEVLSGALVQYNGGTAQGATSYEWWLPGPYEVVPVYDYFSDNWQILQSSTSRNVTVFTGYGEHGGLVQQMGKNTCGRGGAKLLTVEHGNTGGGGGGGIPFKPNPNQGNPVFDSAVQLSLDQIAKVKVFPNPAQSEVSISIEQIFKDLDLEVPRIHRVDVFDVLMKSRLNQDFGKGVEELTLNINFLPPGIYKLAIHTNHGIIMRQIVVEKN